MILMFLFVQGLVDPLINLVDLVLNHKIHQIRQITLDFHKARLQLLHLLVEREQGRWISRVSGRARDHQYQILNVFTFERVMVMVTSHHHHTLEDKRQRSRSRERSPSSRTSALENRKYNL